MINFALQDGGSHGAFTWGVLDRLLQDKCLPSIYHPIQIDGEIYWDGGLAATSPIFPLLFKCRSRDIIIVVINPLEISNIPTNIEEIHERMSDIGFNTSFLREMRAIAFCKNMLAGDRLVSGITPWQHNSPHAADRTHCRHSSTCIITKATLPQMSG